ncbi:putative RNA polymerase II subunit B1 CTD phosphatase RPAP2 [Bombyx mori]|uniref:RNA polymerase II subunit B1 CTD phosphatase RPAP2 homolog n=1 Tax=Bombyx mori TaxID=7091 RepID=A0A8R2G8Z2_BOMMO|nr:putative RNA polymerase II subunit B1 CTD phosphatase RPAP2 [Bombyx mori]
MNKMETNVKPPKKKPTTIEDLTKEQIQQAIIKKRECNSKAQHIVESFLENSINEVYFLKCLPDLNQSHFEDVIEERSIISLCGYPLCSNTLSKKDIPKQKYRISMKTNKVYDITVRKSFCSNSCYKSAMHIKKQMLTSPLWFREYEIIPQFNLLPMNSADGCMGQEIDVSIIDRVKVELENKPFVVTNGFVKATLRDMASNNGKDDVYNKATEEQNEQNFKLSTESTELDEKEMKHKDSVNKASEGKSYILNSESNSVQTQKYLQEKSCPVSVKSENTDKMKKAVYNPMNIVGDIIEKPEKKIDLTLLSAKDEQNNASSSLSQEKKKEKKPLVTVLIVEVEKCLAEWFTLDTLIFLYGEEKVREMVSDKEDSVKEYLKNFTKGTFYNSTAYDQYQALCRKLNMLELEDKRYDAKTMQREMKPLPDYTILQEESKKIQLKVKAFFAGQTEIPEPEPEEKNTQSDENFTALPLVDKNSQNALRRRIVCQHLNKTLPDILRCLGLLSLAISTEVRLLVNTFKLKANNIMFKPIQWTMITIIFIKLLSLRDVHLAHLLEQPMAYQHIQLLLLSYKQDNGYLDRLIFWLTDVDRLLNTNSHCAIE